MDSYHDTTTQDQPLEFTTSQRGSNTSKAKLPFRAYLESIFSTPEQMVAAFYPVLQYEAANLGGLLEDVPALDGRKAYIKSANGKKEKKVFIVGSIKLRSDGLSVPAITIATYKGGWQSKYVDLGDIAYQEFSNSRKAGELPPVSTVKSELFEKMAALEVKIEANKAAALEEKILAQAIGAHNAKTILEQSIPATSHTYLENQGIAELEGIRIAPNAISGTVYCDEAKEMVTDQLCRKGDLVLPVYSSTKGEEGKLINVQTIGANGFKRFQKGGDALGGYMLLGKDEGKLAYVCEGFATGATVYQATGRNVYIAFSANNIEMVAKNKADYVGAIAADAGKAGIAAAEKTGLPIAPPPFTPEQLLVASGDDWNDYAALMGLPATTAELAKTTFKPVQPIKPELTLLNGWDTAQEAQAPEYLIKGILEADAHGILGGASQSLKTFLALKMAFSICSGQEFLGHRVYKTGSVIFVCGEGRGAIERRIKALTMLYGKPQYPLYILGDGITLSSDESMGGLNNLLDQMEEKPALIIFDTFSSLGGGIEENSNSEVAAALARVRDVSRAAGASSLIVHHFGKDAEKGFRGASAFLGNVDFAFTAKREGAPIGGCLQSKLECVKMKDGEFFQPKVFVAKVIGLGINDQEGNEATSLAVTNETGTQAAKPASQDELMLEALIRCVAAQREAAKTNPSIQLTVNIKTWDANADNVSNKPRSRKNLVDSGLVERLAGNTYRPKKA